MWCMYLIKLKLFIPQGLPITKIQNFTVKANSVAKSKNENKIKKKSRRVRTYDHKEKERRGNEP